MVVAGFLRLVTHPRIIVKPLPVKAAIAWVEELRGRGQLTLLSGTS